MVSGPEKGTVPLHLIALGFCPPYAALPPSPEPKHPPRIAGRNQGLAQNTHLISHNPYLLVYCNRTDLSLPKMTQHSRSYKHLPWTHFPSLGKSVSQVAEFLYSKVPFSQMKGTQTGFGLRRCWKGLGKGAGCLGEVNPSSLRAIWGGKIKVGPYRCRPQEPRPAHLG